MTIKAIIPVRSGSTRVKNKNIRPFAGSNLLSIKIKQLQEVKILDGIIVNSNDDEMLDIAKQLGVETVKRNDYYATNSVSINEVYKNQAENCNADYIVHCTVTNPLIKTNTYYELINFFMENDYKSVNSAHHIKEFMWLNNKPLNYEVANMPRSQDLPNILGLNFAINVISKKEMIKCQNVISSKPYLYPINDIEAIDIDEEIDFEFAEFMYKKYRMN